MFFLKLHTSFNLPCPAGLIVIFNFLRLILLGLILPYGWCNNPTTWLLLQFLNDFEVFQTTILILINLFPFSYLAQTQRHSPTEAKQLKDKASSSHLDASWRCQIEGKSLWNRRLHAPRMLQTGECLDFYLCFLWAPQIDYVGSIGDNIRNNRMNNFE